MRLATLYSILLSLLLACPVMAAEKEIKAGFLYVSPVGDGGWSYSHDQARKAIGKMPGVTTSAVEDVPEGPDSERVMLNMARKGKKDRFVPIGERALAWVTKYEQHRIWATISAACTRPDTFRE